MVEGNIIRQILIILSDYMTEHEKELLLENSFDQTQKDDKLKSTKNTFEPQLNPPPEKLPPPLPPLPSPPLSECMYQAMTATAHPSQ
jgi:hypothetical protein